MSTWLLIHQRDASRSCGHLHAQEAAAGHCRAGQTRPDDWEVVRTTLIHSPVPPQRNWGWLGISLCGVGFAALGCLLLAGAAVYFVVRGPFLASLGCLLLGVPLGGLASAMWTAVLDDIRNPKDYYGWGD